MKLSQESGQPFLDKRLAALWRVAKHVEHDPDAWFLIANVAFDTLDLMLEFQVFFANESERKCF